MKIRVFSILAIFEFHLLYRLRKGQRPDQKLNHFTFYDRAINFASDGEKLLLYAIQNRGYSHLKKCSRTGTLSILG